MVLSLCMFIASVLADDAQPTFVDIFWMFLCVGWAYFTFENRRADR